MNKKTIDLTVEEYTDIIETMRKGFSGFRPNNRIATVLVLQANLGLKLSNILELTLDSIVKDIGRYRLDVVHNDKQHTIAVPTVIYNYIKAYTLENGIEPHEVIFPITERAIYKQLKIVTDYLEIDGVGTLSFLKFVAARVYNQNGQLEIALVQKEPVSQSIADFVNNYSEVCVKEFINARFGVPDVTGVYVLFNRNARNKPYVGQGVRVANRVFNHFTGCGNGDVYADYKYGSQFAVKVIPLVDSGCLTLDELESLLIEYYDAYNRGYNKTRGNK